MFLARLVRIPAVVLLGLVAVCSGCKPKSEPVTPAAWTQEKVDAETKHVNDDLAKMQRAVSVGDANTMIAMIPQAMADELGGAEQAKAALQKSFDELLQQGVKFNSWTPGKPTFLESTNYEFVLVATKAEMAINGKTVDSSTVQLGSRKRGETNWRYVDAPRMRKTKHNWVPAFPDDYPIPDQQVEVRN